MTLGEKITQHRKQKGLSQDALAHELNVSRQSISKWETGASVPELEKLVALCDLFELSLDELVRDVPPHNEQRKTPEPPPPPQAVPTHAMQQIIGLILLAIGLLSTLLGFLLLRNIFLLGFILIIYGAVCLLAKRHAGLIIGWITMTPILLLHRSFTGIRLFSVLNPAYYRNSAPANSILAWSIWILLALLMYATVRAIRNQTNT